MLHYDESLRLGLFLTVKYCRRPRISYRLTKPSLRFNNYSPDTLCRILSRCSQTVRPKQRATGADLHGAAGSSNLIRQQVSVR